jgi:hypothetical protein
MDAGFLLVPASLHVSVDRTRILVSKEHRTLVSYSYKRIDIFHYAPLPYRAKPVFPLESYKDFEVANSDYWHQMETSVSHVRCAAKT